MQVELPQKYEVMLLSEKLIIIDEETKDFAEVALNPLRVERNFLRNQRVVNKVVRALSIFQAYKTPSIKSYL
jgi:hypothetical protein